MGNVRIDPLGNLNIAGFGFGISLLFSSEDNYIMFESPVSGSGDVLMDKLAIAVGGLNSQVFALKSNDGQRAFELEKVNFNGCTSLGYIENYRQGLEVGTGRFGGNPELELRGAWNGYRIATSITRGLGVGFTGFLFKAGTGFTMNGSFSSDMNVDLGANGKLCDFAPANFLQTNVLRFKGMRVFRNGVYLVDYTTAVPNITPSDVACAWEDNIGLPNTVKGADISLNGDSVVTVLAANTYYDLTGTVVASRLSHVDNPAGWQLRNTSAIPVDYELKGQFVIAGTANDIADIKVVIYRAATTSFVDSKHVGRVINNNTGPRDVAYFDVFDQFTLNPNDYVKPMIENRSGPRSLTIEDESFYMLLEVK